MAPLPASEHKRMVPEPFCRRTDAPRSKSRFGRRRDSITPPGLSQATFSGLATHGNASASRRSGLGRVGGARVVRRRSRDLASHVPAGTVMRSMSPAPIPRATREAIPCQSHRPPATSRPSSSTCPPGLQVSPCVQRRQTMRRGSATCSINSDGLCLPMTSSASCRHRHRPRWWWPNLARVLSASSP